MPWIVAPNLMSNAAATFTITVGAKPTHTVNPLYFGCHSDSGFTHQVRSFSSQMIFGESFEAPQKNCSYGESAYAWGFNATSPSAIEKAG